MFLHEFTERVRLHVGFQSLISYKVVNGNGVAIVSILASNHRHSFGSMNNDV